MSTNDYQQWAQAQQAQRTMQQHVTTTANAAGTTAFNTLAVTSGTWINAQQQAAIYAQTPRVEQLTTLEPGWVYIRWRKREDADAEAWRVPIIALAIRGNGVEYVLAGATISVQDSALNTNAFLGILTPHQAYDPAEWDTKARAAYRDFHAAEVATALLRGLAAGGKPL